MHRTALLLSTVLALAAAGCGGKSIGFVSTPDTESTILVAWTYETSLVNTSGGVIEYELLTAPVGMTISTDGVVEWTPVYDDLGLHLVELEADDAGEIAYQKFTVRVAQGLFLGVTLSPRGHTMSSTDQDFTDFFAGYSPYGSVIAFHSPWRDDLGSSGQVPLLPQVAAGAALQFGFLPSVGLGFTDGDGDADLASSGMPSVNSFQNTETRADFVDAVTDYALASQPPYLFLGNEMNTYWLNPTTTEADWDAWISTFEECYDSVKTVSPGTFVFTVYQLERMKGLGENAGWMDAPQWDLIADHVKSGKLDGLGFTSYPYLEYDAVAEIPDDYYEEIATYWDGPVVFTELGWLAATSGPYPGSEAEQAGFVPRFFELTSSLDLEYVTWLFLHDLDTQSSIPSIANIGFKTNDGGTTRMSDAAWRAEVLLRE